MSKKVLKRADVLREEAKTFDKQSEERIKHGFIPDLRKLKKVNWFYNNIWRDPEFVKIHLIPKVEFVLKIVKKRRGKVMELGCGYGYLALEMAQNGLDVTAIDLSPKSIKIAEEVARKNRSNGEFGSLEYLCGDIQSMDFGTNVYNSVVFFQSLHHIPDIGPLMLKVKKALKAGGNLIICEPVAEGFTDKSAEFAAILRAVLPTWVPYEQKLRDISNPTSWKKYVDQIYNEYTYKEEHTQSPLDNATASTDAILDSIKNNFKIRNIEYSCAFIEKLIGGLRGKDKYRLATFLEFLDRDFVARKILPPTFVKIYAVKK